MSDQRKVALVTTTIHVPVCLGQYVENAAQHGRANQVEVIVVGDRKTPNETAGYLADLGRKSGVRVTYLDMHDQAKLLRPWTALDVLVRPNCIQRRNVGYLLAAMHGADVIVSVDDDNFVNEGDFLGAHLAVGRTVNVPVVSEPSGWWNICERLVADPPRPVYHRGYPKSRQTFAASAPKVERADVRVAVNAGLWLESPDVDATANIEGPINVVRMEPVAGDQRCALAKGTWCPFNSQNTAFDATTLPAMYLVVMLDVVRGIRIGRLDDIWMSYFVRAIGDALGQSVLYGPPLVTQHRNVHNFLKDLSEELNGYVVTEWLVEHLRRFRTTSGDWFGGYRDLVDHLRDGYERDEALKEPEREYLRTMTLGMGVWLDAVSGIRGGRGA